MTGSQRRARMRKIDTSFFPQQGCSVNRVSHKREGKSKGILEKSNKDDTVLRVYQRKLRFDSIIQHLHLARASPQAHLDFPGENR